MHEDDEKINDVGVEGWKGKFPDHRQQKYVGISRRDMWFKISIGIRCSYIILMTYMTTYIRG